MAMVGGQEANRLVRPVLGFAEGLSAAVDPMSFEANF